MIEWFLFLVLKIFVKFVNYKVFLIGKVDYVYILRM